GDEGVESLIRSPYLTRLTELDLSLWGQDITAAGVRALAGWPGLARLTWLAVNADAEGARALAESPHVAGLRDLVLQYGTVGDEGAAALPNSPHLVGLLRLDLRRNGIGVAGAAALAASPYLRRLRAMWMGDNDIGKAGVAVLKNRFRKRVWL